MSRRRVLWPVALSIEAVQVPRNSAGTSPPAGGSEDSAGCEVPGSCELGPAVEGPWLVGAPDVGCLESSLWEAGLPSSFISAYTEPPAPSATTSATTISAAVERPLRRGSGCGAPMGTTPGPYGGVAAGP